MVCLNQPTSRERENRRIGDFLEQTYCCTGPVNTPFLVILGLLGGIPGGEPPEPLVIPKSSLISICRV